MAKGFVANEVPAGDFAKLQAKAEREKLESELALQIKVAGLPDPIREFVFHPSRKWRFDFAYPDLMLAIECEGGVWSKGRHVRGAGFEADAEKYNQAAILGWCVLRYPSKPIMSGEAIGEIAAVIQLRADVFEQLAKGKE